MAALERSLGQTLKDADAERQVLLQRTAAQLAQAEGEGNSLRRLVRFGDEGVLGLPGAVIVAMANRPRQTKGGLREPAWPVGARPSTGDGGSSHATTSLGLRTAQLAEAMREVEV